MAANFRSVRSWLLDKIIEMYAAHVEGKSVVAERFIRTVKKKIYKYMTSMSNSVYIDKSNDVLKECNNTYYTTIKMKPIDVNSSTYIDFAVETNDRNPKFELGDYVRASKFKDIFKKGYTPDRSED